VLENGVEVWSFSSSKYMQAAVKNVEEYVSKDENKNHWKLPLMTQIPLRTSYQPEQDVLPKLNVTNAALSVTNWNPMMDC
jgi:hypothetical protein